MREPIITADESIAHYELPRILPEGGILTMTPDGSVSIIQENHMLRACRLTPVELALFRRLADDFPYPSEYADVYAAFTYNPLSEKRIEKTRREFAQKSSSEIYQMMGPVRNLISLLRKPIIMLEIGISSVTNVGYILYPLSEGKGYVRKHYSEGVL